MTMNTHATNTLLDLKIRFFESLLGRSHDYEYHGPLTLEQFTAKLENFTRMLNEDCGCAFPSQDAATVEWMYQRYLAERAATFRNA